MRTFHFWRLQFVILTTTTLLATSLSGCSWRKCCVEVGKINRPKLFSGWGKSNEVQGPSVAAAEMESPHSTSSNSLSDEPTLSNALAASETDRDSGDQDSNSIYYPKKLSTSSTPTETPTEPTAAQNDGNSSRVATLDPQLNVPPAVHTSTPATIDLPVVDDSSTSDRGRQAGSAIIDLGNEKIVVEPFDHTLIGQSSPPSTIVRQMFGNPTINSSANPIRSNTQSVHSDSQPVEPHNPDLRFSQQLQPNQSLLVKNHTVRDSHKVDLTPPEGIAFAPQASTSETLTAPASRIGQIQDREVLIDDLPTLKNNRRTIELAANPGEANRLAQPNSSNNSGFAPSTARNSEDAHGEDGAHPKLRTWNLPTPPRDTADHSDTREIRLQARADFPYTQGAVAGPTAYQPPAPPVRIAARPWSQAYQVPATHMTGDRSLANREPAQILDPDTQWLTLPQVNKSVPTHDAGWQITPLPPTSLPHSQTAPVGSGKQSDIQLRLLPPAPPSSRSRQGD